MLDELLSRYQDLPEEEQAELTETVAEETEGMLWIPSPGPQTEAYFCKADILLYGGAGDLPMLFCSEKVSTIKSDGLLLGFSKDSKYENYNVDMKKGDKIFLITDGIIESRNDEGKMLTQNGLIKMISGIKKGDDILKKIKNEFAEFTSNDFDDDVSIVVIKRS